MHHIFVNFASGIKKAELNK